MEARTLHEPAVARWLARGRFCSPRWELAVWVDDALEIRHVDAAGCPCLGSWPVPAGACRTFAIPGDRRDSILMLQSAEECTILRWDEGGVYRSCRHSIRVYRDRSCRAVDGTACMAGADIAIASQPVLTERNGRLQGIVLLAEQHSAKLVAVVAAVSEAGVTGVTAHQLDSPGGLSLQHAFRCLQQPLVRQLTNLRPSTQTCSSGEVL